MYYLGEAPPGMVPEIFAPGFISVENRIEGRGTFSPDCKEFYFTVTDQGFSNQKIFIMLREVIKNGDIYWVDIRIIDDLRKN